MSYIKGGETEKLGNQYEDYVLIYYYGRLMADKFVSIKSESFDRELERGGDIYLKDKIGKTTVVQAKSRNGDKNEWTVKTLIQKGLIKNACYHINNGRDYCLVSPLNCFFLKDLCRHSLSFNDVVKFRNELINESNKVAFSIPTLDKKILENSVEQENSSKINISISCSSISLNLCSIIFLLYSINII